MIKINNIFSLNIKIMDDFYQKHCKNLIHLILNFCIINIIFYFKIINGISKFPNRIFGFKISKIFLKKQSKKKKNLCKIAKLINLIRI